MLRNKKKIYYLNPFSIVAAVGGRKNWPWYTQYYFKKRLYWPFQTLGGNWDQVKTSTGVYREEEMEQLFIDKLPPHATTTYHNLMEELNRNGFTRHPPTNSVDEIEKYFDKVKMVFNSIKTEGYKSCDELGLRRKHEIHIRVTRNGKFVKSGEGTHRLAMARLLDIKEVPVVIDLIHSSIMKQWKIQSRSTGLDPISFGAQQANERMSK